MKRKCILTVACGLLCLAGCDRQTVSWLILNIGFNVRPEQFQVQSADVEIRKQPTVSAVSQSAETLAELRAISADVSRSALEIERAGELVERVAELADLYSERASSDETLSAVLREGKLAALEIGARLNPPMFSEAYRDFRSEILLNSTGMADLERTAVNRLITQYLSSTDIDPVVREVLKLHTASYPTCTMNADLYTTASRQFANLGRVTDSVLVAEEGLSVLGQQAETRVLTEHLQQLYAEYPTAIGVPMNFASPDLKGQRRELKSFRGNPVLVVFWATWCEACQQEIVAIQSITEPLRERGLRVVGVSLDQKRSDLEKYIADHQIDWVQIFSDHPQASGWDNPIAQYYRVDSVPYTFLLDSDGKIHAAGLTSKSHLEAAVEALLSDDV